MGRDCGGIHFLLVTITNTEAQAYDVEILNTVPYSLSLTSVEFTSSPEPTNVAYTNTVQPESDLDEIPGSVTIEDGESSESSTPQDVYWSGVSEIPVGGVWTVKYRMSSSAAIPASMRLVDRAEIIRYTSGSGSSGDRDRNGKLTASSTTMVTGLTT